MSISMVPAALNPSQIFSIVVPIAAVASLAVMAAMGVFKPRSIVGPVRLSPGESPRVFLLTLGFALMAWAFSVLATSACHQTIAKKKHQPPGSGFSDSELVVYSAATDGVVFFALLVATITNRPDGIRKLGIALAQFPAGLTGGALGILLALPLIFCVDAATQHVLQYFHKSSPPHELLEILKTNSSFWLRATVVFSAAVVAPFAEETIFRGQVQTLLRSVFKRSWPAVVATSALFAMVHPWWNWPQIFFLAICLGYVYERTGNLWMSIVMHSIFNLTAMGLFTQFN